jgi:WD40 repeat protein
MDSGRGLICWSAKEGFRRYELATGHMTSLGAKPVPVQIPSTFFLYIGRTRLSPNLSTVAQLKNGEVEIWNIVSGEKENVLKHETGAVTSQAFSDDGSMLATIGQRGEVRLWKTDGWKSETLASNLTEQGRLVKFSANGRMLAVHLAAGASQYLLVFDLSSRAPPVKISTTNVSYSLLFSPDASLLFVGRYDGSIRIYDLSAQKEVSALQGHLGAVMDMALSPDGRTLASCGDDHLVKLWNVASRQEILTLPSLRANSGALMFSPDGTWLAVDSAEERVQLWHAPSWTEIDATQKTNKAP